MAPRGHDRRNERRHDRRHDDDAGGSPELLAAKQEVRERVWAALAVPRLAGPDPFFLLDPDDLGDRTPRRASSIKGATAAGRTVAVAELEPVDLVVAGCVAVTARGDRLGKGGGFSDLEFAVAFEAGLVAADTPVVTTVHEDQIVDELPVVAHDVALDLIVTAERILDCERPARHDLGIVWDELTEAKIAAIPLLEALRKS